VDRPTENPGQALDLAASGMMPSVTQRSAMRRISYAIHLSIAFVLAYVSDATFIDR
jgi:hypothetical protein